MSSHNGALRWLRSIGQYTLGQTVWQRSDCREIVIELAWMRPIGFDISIQMEVHWSDYKLYNIKYRRTWQNEAERNTTQHTTQNEQCVLFSVLQFPNCVVVLD